MFNWFPAQAANWTFHLWALSGLTAGLMGWAFVLFVLACKNWIIARKEKAADKLGEHFTGLKDDK